MLAFARRHWAALLWPGFAVAVILFYSIPLFKWNTTIHWDLADVTYPAQKFFADSLRMGKLPFWTPYLDSGIPFLADPRTGAWYPLHWLFFAIGITPRTMVWELALHAFLALGGAYLLAKRLFGAPGPAVLAAVLYGWGGYFAAHASLLPGFEAGALLPWLLWGALDAVEAPGTRWVAFTSLIMGLIVLAGDVSAAFEASLALVCVAAAAVYAEQLSWSRGITVIASAVILGLMLGGIQMAPAMELYAQSHLARSGARFVFGALATVVAGDYYSLLSGLYTGPEDPRQYYLYSGLLLAPLAIAGIVRRERWMVLLALFVPTVAFDAALRPPGDSWFAAALGLALAAGSGAMWIEKRVERPHLWIPLLALSVVDLWFWNIYRNPLVFAHATFAEVYGQTPIETSNEHLARPFARTWAPYVPVGAGPADGSLIARTEVTYGSGLAELDRYQVYSAAIEKNQKLLNGLGVTDIVLGRGRRLDNPDSLGRVSVPGRVDFVADRKAAAAGLAMLDPAKSAMAEAPGHSVGQAVRSIQITGYTGDTYHIKYSAAAESLVRVAVPSYPGWSAAVDGTETALVPVDEALMGVVVPTGEHELTLEYHSHWFLLGLSLTLAAAIAVVIGLILT